MNLSGLSGVGLAGLQLVESELCSSLTGGPGSDQLTKGPHRGVLTFIRQRHQRDKVLSRKGYTTASNADWFPSVLASKHALDFEIYFLIKSP